MSEGKKKARRHTNMWALNLSSPDNPLQKSLMKEAEVTNAIHADGTVNKMKLIEGLLEEALQTRFQKRGYMEGLGLLAEYRRRRETIEAIATGKPLPTTTAPQPITQPPVSTPLTSDPTQATQPTQTTPTPAKPTEKKPRREGVFFIGSSGHMKESK